MSTQTATLTDFFNTPLSIGQRFDAAVSQQLNRLVLAVEVLEVSP